ncbi:MAG: holo-ACP synthase [Rickettsiaceae bacterium]|nr:holo-ACP synthase [Rickettsiaceae bacterium]
MTIHGIGCDLVNCLRIEQIFLKYPASFIKRILGQIEIRKFSTLNDQKTKVSFLAKRFAAKEAVAKAFGTGIGQTLEFKDIQIDNDYNGKPKVILPKNLLELTINYQIHISISDEWPIAIAFVIISV